MDGRNKLLAGVLLYLGALALTGTCRAQELSATGFAPANTGGICFDTPLSITFNQPPLQGAGSVNVYQANGTLVTSVNVANATSTKSFGGSTLNYYPIIITGNTAAIYLPVGLAYNQSYYVLVDSGAFRDAAGDSFGISDSSVWTFSTKPGGPAAGSTSLTVASDYSGDFCTVQGAVDFVPTNNTQRVTVTVRSGNYTEIVRIPSNKPFITIKGQDRNLTVIQYANNDRLNPGTSGRPMFLTQANDFVLQDITLHNTTPHGGSQAEAIRSRGQRAVFNRVNLESFQDTWLQNGTAFITNSYIEGDVDFMWGTGASFFQYSELKAMTPGSIYDQFRNVQGQKGVVYVNSTLTRHDSSVVGAYLARIDPTVYPYSQVVHINSAMDSHVVPLGWQLNTAPGNDCSQAPNIQFWEYHSTDLNGNPLDVSQRLACSRQLSDAEAAQWSDPAFVLNGWVPNTVNATPGSVAAGQSINVNWSAPQGHSTSDWVGLYTVGADDSNYASQQLIASSATTGVLTFAAPAAAGQYEFRYFLSDNTKVATSGTVTASATQLNLAASARSATVAPGSITN